MHTDTRDLENGTTIKGDICIIGAGAAGISMALEWDNTPYKVVLLESGGFEYESELQNLNSGQLTGQKYFPLESTRLRYFGGTTGHWTGLCSPLDEVDFMKRDYFPYSGWPITKKDLDPFYLRAQNKLQLGPYEYDLNYWKDSRPNLNAFPLDQNIVKTKMWQISSARFGSLYKEKIFKSKNIHLYTYASATNINSNETVSEIEGIAIKNHTGNSYKVKAKYYMMACGAIQNARLLLSSRDRAPNGLGNNHDVVGRYFMEHLDTKAAGELWLFEKFETDLYSWGGGIKSEMTIADNMQLKSEILNATVSIPPLEIGKHMKPLIETWQDADPRKAEENTENRSLLSKIMRLKTKVWKPTAFDMDCNSEQAPNPMSRITLGVEKDALGVQKPILSWQLSPIDKITIKKTLELIGQQMGQKGLGRVKLSDFLQDEDDGVFPTNLGGAFHHMGTTRMHTDPRFGVVDANCQVHGISNLFVAGSGCFTTSGSVNPTLTLVALSLRLSDYVKNVLNSESI